MVNTNSDLLSFGKSKILIFLYGITLLVMLAINPHLQTFKSNRAVDFVQFWLVGQSIQNVELTNIYSFSDKKKILSTYRIIARQGDDDLHLGKALEYRRKLNFAGTPFLYTCFYLISEGDYNADYNVYRWISLGLFLVSIIIFCFLSGYSFLADSLAIVVLVFCYWPLQADIFAGNVNQLQLGILAFGLLAFGKEKGRLLTFLGAFILGTLIYFKPNLIFIPTLFMIMWFFDKRYKTLLTAVLGFCFASVAAFLLPLILFGNKCTWSEWIACVGDVATNSKYMKNSFIGMLIPGDSALIHQFVGVTALVGVAALIKVKSDYLRQSKRINSLMDYRAREYYLLSGIGILLYILTSPMVHSHYFLLISPLFIFHLRPENGDAEWVYFRRVFCLCGILLLSLHPIFIELDLHIRWFNNTIWSYLSALLLLIVSLIDFYRIHPVIMTENRAFELPDES